MKEIKLKEFSVVLALIVIGVVLRFLPHAPNFTPVAAIALFGGAYLSKRAAVVLPLMAMVISDFFIGYYEVSLMLSVYVSFLLCVAVGIILKQCKKWQIVVGGSVLSALLFFFVTNFAVWAFTSWYPHSFAGLVECYLAALPFSKNMLLSNLFYSTVLFGGYQFVLFLINKKVAIKKQTENI